MSARLTPCCVPTGPGPYWAVFWATYTGDPKIDIYLARVLAQLQQWRISVYHVAEKEPRLPDRSGLIGLCGHDEALFIMAYEHLDSDLMVSSSKGGEHRIRLDQIEGWHIEEKARAGNLSEEERRVYNAGRVEP